MRTKKIKEKECLKKNIWQVIWSILIEFMFKDNSKIINFIVDWLNDYCVQNSVEGFVVGVSGGIDSALTSTLCSMTKKPVLCIQMPIHQSKNEFHNLCPSDMRYKHYFYSWAALVIQKDTLYNKSKITSNFQKILTLENTNDYKKTYWKIWIKHMDYFGNDPKIFWYQSFIPSFSLWKWKHYLQK